MPSASLGTGTRRQPGGADRRQRPAVGRRLDERPRPPGEASARTAVTSAAWPPGQIDDVVGGEAPARLAREPRPQRRHALDRGPLPGAGPAAGAGQRGRERRRRLQRRVEVAGAERERALGRQRQQLAAARRSPGPRHAERDLLPAEVRGRRRAPAARPRTSRGRAAAPPAPSAASAAIARWTVTGEAPCSRISSRTDGSRAPSGRVAARSRSAAAMRSAGMLRYSKSWKLRVTLSRRDAIAASPPRRERSCAGSRWRTLGVAIFSFSLPATRLAVADLDPMFVAFGRAAVAAVLGAIVLRALARAAPAPRAVALARDRRVRRGRRLPAAHRARAAPRRRHPRRRRDRAAARLDRGVRRAAGGRVRRRAGSGSRPASGSSPCSPSSPRAGSARSSSPTSSCSAAPCSARSPTRRAARCRARSAARRRSAGRSLLAAPLSIPVTLAFLPGGHVGTDAWLGFAYVSAVLDVPRLLRLVRGPRAGRRGQGRPDAAAADAAHARARRARARRARHGRSRSSARSPCSPASSARSGRASSAASVPPDAPRAVRRRAPRRCLDELFDRPRRRCASPASRSRRRPDFGRLWLDIYEAGRQDGTREAFAALDDDGELPRARPRAPTSTARPARSSSATSSPRRPAAAASRPRCCASSPSWAFAAGHRCARRSSSTSTTPPPSASPSAAATSARARCARSTSSTAGATTRRCGRGCPRPNVNRLGGFGRRGGVGRGRLRLAGVSPSASGGLAPSRAHGSSNSTRHLPSGVCSSARRARNERPERPLKPVTGLRRLAGRDQLARDRHRELLAGLALPDHEAAARVLARPAREALAVLDDVVAADRAGPEVGARDAHVLELRVELGDRRRGRTRRCRP